MGKGIPQGLPISAFLANLYLLDFDIKVLRKVQSFGGLYRRYSDDIIVLCPEEAKDEIKKYLTDEIKNKYYLEINDEKTETSIFREAEDGSIINLEKPLRYLGFELNENGIYLKSSTLAKYYRRMKTHVKGCTYKTKQMRKYVDKNEVMWTSRIRRKYSTKGIRNFLSYAKNAARIMGNQKILKQIKNHRKLLHEYIQLKR